MSANHPFRAPRSALRTGMIVDFEEELATSKKSKP